MNDPFVEYRLNFLSAGSGELLAQTEFTANRERIVYLADIINSHCRGKVRAHPETKALGWVDTSKRS